ALDAVRATRAGRATQIVGYRGFGTATETFVSGRVLLGRALTAATEHDPWWRNLANTYRRMESDEVSGARVRIRLHGAEREAVSVDEGYFRAWLQPQAPLPAERLWHPVDLELIGGPGMASSVTHVLTPAAGAVFGVVSDIDDTVIRTDATNFLRMMRGVLFSNARTRLPFEGVAAFYQALHRGATGIASNPIFYVSSSPWNLYDVLTDFLDHRSIPIGPLFLRDWGIRGSSIPTGHRTHKLGAIRQILDTYPALPFLLIGDSGQQDPEIYAEIVAHYPRRILGIYIRDVTGHAERRASIEALAQEVHSAGSVLVLAEDTVAASRHAVAMGWMRPESVEGVRVERSREHEPGPPPPEHEPVVIE
ncbi:MAG: App1 family protein, partial [Longimicrobiales bacterium]